MNIQYPRYLWNEKISSATSTSTASGTFVDLITLTAIDVTGAFPVFIECVAGALYANAVAGTITAEFAIYRGGTQLSVFTLESYVYGGANNQIRIPATLRVKDAPSVGSHTYKLAARIITGSNAGITDVKLMAYEGFHF